MADHALERSNLFQLNVLIWATLTQPHSAPVNPILSNLGYCLFSIEQPLEPSITQQASLQEREPPVSIAPVADVILDNPGKSHLVVMECKSSSFGVESHQARQARGFILAGGDIMRRGLPITSWSSNHEEICRGLLRSSGHQRGCDGGDTCLPPSRVTGRWDAGLRGWCDRR